jgi:YfiH family protein
MKPNLLDTLRNVNWSEGYQAETTLQSRLLHKLGVSHGFAGVFTSHPEGLHTVDQVHGNHAVRVHADSSPSSQIKADALWTNTARLGVAVRTADCLPVLFVAPQENQVAAAHAGWRGLTQGILIETLALFSANPSEMTVCIGPSISRQNFEVGVEVVDALCGPAMRLKEDQLGYAVSKGKGDRWHIDLQTSAVLQLLNLGVSPKNIEVIQTCTFQESKEWYSYRRSQKVLGSNWSWVYC